MLDVKYNNITVFYEHLLNGGGLEHCDHTVDIFANNIGKVDHLYEFCSGPGFFGFALLANNLCDKLTLSDINPDAIDLCNKTIEYNNLHDKVTIIQSDGLNNISSKHKFDAVISNPPWFAYKGKGSFEVHDRMFLDHNFDIHRNFYSNISKYLNTNTNILMLESYRANALDAFGDFIINNELKLIEVIPYYDLYYIRSKYIDRRS